MRNLLGKSLHSIQKFYSHSNWLELGNENVLDLIWDDFGNIADEFESTCDDSDIIVEKLTSGYFPHNVRTKSKKVQCSKSKQSIFFLKKLGF